MYGICPMLFYIEAQSDNLLEGLDSLVYDLVYLLQFHLLKALEYSSLTLGCMDVVPL